MSLPCRLALVGLPPVDRSLLEALFLQTVPHGSAYEMVNDLDRADLVISNADDTHAIRLLQDRKLRAPVLLIGDSDGGTGWPTLSRPIQPHAVMDAVALLGPFQPEPAVRRPARSPGKPPARLGGAAPRSPDARPAFAATEPFAPLERSDAPGPAAGSGSGFEATRSFDASVTGSPAPRRSAATQPVADDSIDARSVLMWRDAQGGPAPAKTPQAPRRPADGSPAGQPVPGFPVMAGFEPTRDAVAAERAVVPANWLELARQQAVERVSRPQRLVEDEAPSSSFADAVDNPTAPQSLAAPGPTQVVLLVTRPRTKESSLVKALRHFGCSVDGAPDSITALKRLALQNYSLVILDDKSLGDETLALCRALRKRCRALGQRPRIAVVARGDSLLRRLFARLAGCDEWMTTPLRKSRLGQIVRDSRSDRPA